jgi:cyclic pyranopterin phosphate synthase
MCHPLPLELVDVNAEVIRDRIRVESRVICEARTGPDMEAMAAAAVAALTVYDMVKSAGKSIEIGPVRLLEKSGGRSGHWQREEQPDASR